MKTSIGLGLIIFLAVALCSSDLAAQEVKAAPLNPQPATSTNPQVQPSSSPQPIQQPIQPGQEPSPQPIQPPLQSGQEIFPQQTIQPAPLTEQQAAEQLSEFEVYVSGKMPASVSLDLRQFGYNLFRKPPSTFAPAQNVPVGPDYVLGPGDELRITVWGKIEGAWNAVVDRDGTISLPKVGVLGVTGLTFREVKSLLFNEFSKYYTGFEMNVSMGSLRTIRVYVVGNALRPGAYTISSLSTLINALFEAGGPSRTGTLRDIQVKRNGETVVHFDLYDLLLRGDKTNDIRLLPEDVIFIPSVGPLAGVAGYVRKPAIYELKGETRLRDLIQMAGGLTGIAYKGRVQVKRIEDHQFRTVFEGDLIDVEKSPEKNFILQDGDLLKVFSVVEALNTITVTGAVAHPGEYGISPGVTRVKDIISLAGGLLYFASEKAEVTRLTVTQEGPRTSVSVIDLSRALKGDSQNDILLEINDYIFVRSVPEWDLYKRVTITGEVNFPGIYTIRKGERLSSLVERSGGLTDKAYPRGAVFTREKIKELQQKQIDDMVDRLERELLSMGTSQAATASTSDEARLFQMETAEKTRFIQRLRSVRAKGRISINLAPSEKLKDTPFDVELEDGDSLYIPSDPKIVQVIGSVYNQTAFVFERSKDYHHYLTLAGGLTENADEDNIYILRANGTALKLEDLSSGLTWNSEKLRWETGGMRVESGDTVVVPEKLERIAWMRNIKDITQILYQIAVGAGVVIAAF